MWKFEKVQGAILLYDRPTDYFDVKIIEHLRSLQLSKRAMFFVSGACVFLLLKSKTWKVQLNISYTYYSPVLWCIISSAEELQCIFKIYTIVNVCQFASRSSLFPTQGMNKDDARFAFNLLLNVKKFSAFSSLHSECDYNLA